MDKLIQGVKKFQAEVSARRNHSSSTGQGAATARAAHHLLGFMNRSLDADANGPGGAVYFAECGQHRALLRYQRRLHDGDHRVCGRRTWGEAHYHLRTHRLRSDRSSARSHPGRGSSGGARLVGSGRNDAPHPERKYTGSLRLYGWVYSISIASGKIRTYAAACGAFLPLEETEPPSRAPSRLAGT